MSHLSTTMDSHELSLSALKDKVSSKLSAKPSKKGQKNNADDNFKPSGKQGKFDKLKKSAKGNKEGFKKLEKSGSDKKVLNDSSQRSSLDELLTREAMALGATKEDLELINGIDDEQSETEFGDSKVDEGLNVELSTFMSTLGFPSEAPIVADEDVIDEVDDEVDEEEDEDEDETDIKNDKDDDEEDATNAEKKAAEAEVQVQEVSLKKKESDKVTNLNSVNSEKLNLEVRVDWYNIESETVESPEKMDRFGVERLTERAQAFIEKENKIYLEEFTSNNSQKRFLSQILSDGTLNDKISALTLLVQEAPMHNMKAFDTLLGYCEKKSRTAALQAIEAMKDLLLNGLLPDRKLVSFAKQPLSSNLSDTKIALYYFEDYLKKSYFKFIQVVEHLLQDPILHVRMNAVSHIFDLLKSKPEQEANLLRLGVNKLGDTEKKVAAKTSYQILQLEQAHPAMKKIIVDSVSDMVLQKSKDHHAQYYTTLTLNQTILSSAEPELANSLIKIYFSLFEKILVESDPALKEKKEDKTLGKTETGRKNNRKSFKKGKKGGKSIKVAEKTEEEIIEEKSSKLFSALLTGLNRAFPYSDLPSEIYMKHLDTLYKITHSTNFNTSIQALVLVQHIVTQQDLDKDRFYRTLYESLLDPRLINSSKQGIYLNLLFKSLKNDINNVPRILAFVKRILQTCSHWLNIGSTAGMFFLLMELSKTHPQILELLEAVGARPDHKILGEAEDKDAEPYDPKKRNPGFANAEKSCLWEISQFVNHYHPTVALYADSLLEGKSQPKPDLGLYSLAHFLDRFVYKNAKQKASTKGSSIMQPLGGAHTGSLLVRATNIKSTEIPVNTVNWLSKKAAEIKPDEKFFYEYFSANLGKVRNKKVAKKIKEGEDEDEREEMSDEEVWDALVKLKPDVEGLSDAEGFSDLDEDDFSDMDLSDDENEDAEVTGFDLHDSEKFENEVAFGNANESESEEEDEELAIDEEFGAVSDEEDMFNINEDDEYSSDDADADSKKRTQKSGDEEKKKKKPKLLGLPVFASVDDYAQYLESDDE